MYVFRKAKYILPTQLFKNLYFSLVQSLIEYEIMARGGIKTEKHQLSLAFPPLNKQEIVMVKIETLN